jgi:hypothetical protein
MCLPHRAFLFGNADAELTQADYDHLEADYAVVIGVWAVK